VKLGCQKVNAHTGVKKIVSILLPIANVSKKTSKTNIHRFIV